MAGMGGRAFGGGSRSLTAAISSGRARRSKTGKGKGKGKEIPLGSSELGKFLGIPKEIPGSSDTAQLFWKFIKLNKLQNPSLKKHTCGEKLKAMLEGKDRVGYPEISKLLFNN